MSALSGHVYCYEGARGPVWRAKFPPVTLAEPLLTADQVSRLLGIPRSSVYEYARRGEDPLPAVRVGRHVRFHRTVLERWLAEQHG